MIETWPDRWSCAHLFGLVAHEALIPNYSETDAPKLAVNASVIFEGGFDAALMGQWFALRPRRLINVQYVFDGGDQECYELIKRMSIRTARTHPIEGVTIGPSLSVGSNRIEDFQSRRIQFAVNIVLDGYTWLIVEIPPTKVRVRALFTINDNGQQRTISTIASPAVENVNILFDRAMRMFDRLETQGERVDVLRRLGETLSAYGLEAADHLKAVDHVPFIQYDTDHEFTVLDDQFESEDE